MAPEVLTPDGPAAPLDALGVVIAVAAGVALSRQPTLVAAYGIGGLVLAAVFRRFGPVPIAVVGAGTAAIGIMTAVLGG